MSGVVITLPEGCNLKGVICEQPHGAWGSKGNLFFARGA